jgi:hypothetical protein
MSSAVSDPIFVRIKPRNVRKRPNPQRYTIFGLRFEEERGWYEIARTAEAVVSGEYQAVDVAKFLSEVREGEDPNAPLMFDVCSEKEAKEIQTREHRQKAESAAAELETDTPAELGTVTTADLPAGPRERMRRERRA